MISRSISSLRNVYEKHRGAYSLFEIIVVLGNYFLIMYVLRFWYWGVHVAVVTSAVTSFIFISSFFVHRNTLKELGVRFDNIKTSAKECGLASLLGFLIIFILFAFQVDEFRPREPLKVVSSFLEYLSWGVFQQFFLLSFLFLRLKEFLKNKPLAIFAAGILFALMHSPNKPLMILTFLCGVAACFLFLRNRNIFILGIMHAFLAVTVHLMLVPGFIPKTLRVGPAGYHRYELYGYGATVASGDIDGDGVSEIIVGGGPHGDKDSAVYIYDNTGELKETFLAYDPNVHYGVRVASGDVDGDGLDEIITAKGPAHENDTLVSVYDGRGEVKFSFVAFACKRYGANVATGDIDGDGMDEILVSPGPGQGYKPIIKIFNSTGEMLFRFRVNDYIEIPEKRPLTVRHGLQISAGDVDGDGSDEILVGLAHLKDYWVHVTVVDFVPEDVVFTQRPWFAPFEARYGSTLASGDVTGDGIDEILVGRGPGAYNGGVVTVFGDGWEKIAELTLFDLRYGINVASVGVFGIGRDQIIAAPGPGPDYPATVKLLDVLEGKVLLEFTAFQ
jgi:membrane protease YdiL (CAAX protease family)